MTTISNLGVGSGLDLSSLLDQLTTAEQAPLTAIKTQQSSYQTKLSAYGQLQSMLAAFQASANQLSNPTFFQSTTASASNTSVLSATGSTTAVPGTYSVNVTQLAQSQSVVSTGQASQTTAVGTGTIHIDFGAITGGTLDSNPASATYGKYTGATFTANSGSTGVDITIDSSNNTLQGVRDAINKANAGVTASIVNDGSGTPYRLVISSNATGATNSVRMSVNETDGGTGLSDLVAYDPAGTQNMQQTIAAQNAQLTVNNIAVQSKGNSVADAVPGVVLNLTQTGTSSVTVQRDNSSIVSGVQAFVAAYNNLQNTAASLSAYDPSTKTGSPLTGDSTLSIIQSQMRSVMNTPQSGNALTTLSQIGISFQNDGTLALDTTKLTSALNSNPGAVAGLFGNTDGVSGYGNQINKLVTGLTSSNGALTTATAGINNTLKDLSNQYDETQTRVDAVIANYKTQFTQLDVIMSQMQNTSSYLTQQFSAMNGTSSSKK
ncbi:flagellar hook-associated protein 2 [Cupriavidus metallidurans]|jgi:flagellar hook-associated protein 2|uniref:Flagellar hook-associated protein 2 n=1 Tax=Cupriavidus metallidurans TaxID=119219 RepID=A0A132HFU8_9BURK|nr:MULTISPECIES: flagellar filament capping protein FliD [Cupriavidus]PCH54864.1 MAG: flagellar filament capping protein FliD [Burkholderiaceae bacterium]AVA35765.1 flagellar filament capping protein FliD [Cupriavidus metallidurans]KWR85625.1 flagellar hook protein [Cupriavidus sp. SHE]KWW35617.1 Flagellar hook-associated protein 2 [Cupriavidus metallidurans]MDE4921758.1 flagellar filament capping protein FliD [Cupriavidus metallidurans]